MNSLQSRKEYLRRIHKVQDYIEENLNKPLVLSELAEIAGFSKYHFHRLFSAIANESLLQYVNRIKMERAALLLIHRPDVSVTYIAYYYGFSDSAVFSRTFRKHFALSPTAYRKQYGKNCKDPAQNPTYNGVALNYTNGSDTVDISVNVELVTMEEIRVVYIRYTGTYEGLASAFPDMMQRLYDFAMRQNLIEPGKTKILSAYHDNPEMTSENQLRTSLCISIPNTAVVEESGDIGTMLISGQFAVGHFEVYQSQLGAAWNYMYSEWLPNSGYQPRDAFPFEVYVSDPNANPKGKQLVDIYLPVEPLGAI